MRKLVSSGSSFEPIIGFSRAVRVGDTIEIAGTAPIGADGHTAGVGDAYLQMRRCIEIATDALREAGGELTHVTRTRILLTNIAHWRDAGRAHGEIFAEIRPATTVMQVGGFIDPDWLVEIEVTAVINR